MPIQIYRGLNINDVDSYSFKSCDLKIIDCNPTSTDGILSGCNDVWNCNLCQTDSVYFIPVIETRKFHIQTQFVDFFNADEENPVSGFGSWITVELYNAANNTLLSSNVSEFTSRHGVGWTGQNSYQILEIDPSSVIFDGIDCFYFQLTANENGAGSGPTPRVVTLCSEQYRFSGPCDVTQVLRGIYPDQTFDCLGNFYGPGLSWTGSGVPIIYRNDILIDAEFIIRGDSITKQIVGVSSKRTNNRRAISVEVKSTTELLLVKPVAPFMKNVVMKQILSAQLVRINGNNYDLEEYSLDNLYRDSRMFLFNVPLTENCNSDFRCKSITTEDNTSLVIPTPVPPESCVDCIPAITCIGP